MNFSDAGVRSCCQVTFIGPPPPRSSLAPPSQSSIRLKLGSTSWKDQPLHPAAAQSSKFLRLPRTNTMPLIEPEPPSTRPRGCGIRRPSAAACGAV